MKFMKNWKRFWTLNAHHEAGFTLVELIIVIAILAILAGVAVPAYSGYIAQANKSNDETMAAEIKQALTLALYSEGLNAGDYVVINYGAEAVSGNSEGGTTEKIDKAMSDAFGTNWKSALKLSYSDWDLSVVADGELMGYVNNSNFDKNSLGGLLNSVQYITDAFNGVMADGRVTIAADSDLAKYFQQNGIDYTTNTQAASNATVMYVGSVLGSNTVNSDDFVTAWMEGDYSQITTDPFAENAARYASILAMAKYIDGLHDTDYETQLSSATDASQVLNKANEVADAMAAAYPADIQAYMAGGTSSKAHTDAMAFLAYMKGMSSSSDKLMSNTDLSNNTYFTDGTVLNYVTNYISVSDILGAVNVDNAFVFMFDGEKVVCVPLDY